MPRVLLIGTTLLVALVATAQEPRPRYTVHTTDEVIADAALDAVGDDGAVRVDTKTIPGPKLIELRREGVPLPPPPTGDFVLLTHGDCLPLSGGVRLEGGRLLFRTGDDLPAAGGKELSVFPPYVAAIVRAVPAGVDDPARFVVRLKHDSRLRDVVHLKDGDRIEGTVTALDPVDGIEIKADRRTVTAAWADVAAVAFNTERQARPRFRKASFHAVTAGGGRVHFTTLRLDAGRWVGKTWFGASFDVPADRLVALSVLNGPAVPLGELTPARYEHVPYLGVAWPLAVDRGVTGGPLRLGGSVYDRGLGMHAESRVTYQLDGGYRWFEAVAGMDASAGRVGRARLAVLVDGARHDLGPKEWGAGDAPQAVRLDVRGAKTLTLIAERGNFGDVRAHVGWGDARLVKGD